MTIIKLAIGADHGGLELKTQLIKYLKQTHPDITIEDMGTHSKDSVDYPDFAKLVAEVVAQKQADLGILVCGTGIGVSMMANRYKGVRAALVHNELTAKMAKEHNNANILCLGERTTDPKLAEKLVDTWLAAEFGGDRHERRVNKLDS